MRQITYLPRPPTLSQWHMDLHVWSYPWRSYIFQASSISIQGFRSHMDQKLAIPITLATGFYNRLYTRRSRDYNMQWVHWWRQTIYENTSSNQLDAVTTAHSSESTVSTALSQHAGHFNVHAELIACRWARSVTDRQTDRQTTYWTGHHWDRSHEYHC